MLENRQKMSFSTASTSDITGASGFIAGVRVDGWVGPLLTHSVSTYVGHEPFSLW